MKHRGVLCTFMLVIVGCGGGTSGTGLDSVASGAVPSSESNTLLVNVRTPEGIPQPGLLFTVVSSSPTNSLPDTIVTDGRGQFVLIVSPADYPLNIRRGEQDVLTLEAPSSSPINEVFVEVKQE